jgi:hypothetical protein
LHLGKGGATWEHAQGVDPSSLDNMGTLERLDDPINTPTRSHNDQHERTHKERGVPKDGAHHPRDMMVDGHVGLDGCTGSMEGAMSHLSVGSQRGMTHPKDMTFHTSDPWSSYKSKGHTTKGRHRRFGKIFGEQV